MNDIDAVGEISVFREISEVTPESEDEDQPGNPYDVEDASRKEMVEKVQASRDAGNSQEMSFKFVEVEQEQYARGKVCELCWKLHLQLRVDAS